MRRYLVVEHFQKIGQWHVRHLRIDATVAAAMSAREIAAQCAFPKKRVQPMFGNRCGVKV